MTQPTQHPERLLIIGWDGADWEILNDLIERGHLPNVADMRRKGASGSLLSTIPSHSWAAWTTFLTGANCGRHGVYDFVERRPGETGAPVPVSSDSIRTTTFLEHLSAAGHEVRAANIPVTFPPIPVRGRMISGVAVPPGASFVYPAEWGDELAREAPFPLNGMEWARFRDDPNALVDEAKRYVELRSDSYEALLEGDWSVAACVFVAPDRLQHPFGAYLLPSHPRYRELAGTALAASIREVYSELDAQIARLREKAGPRTTTVLMSDHGFRPVDRVANLDDVLVELGFANRPSSSGRRHLMARGAARAARVARRIPLLRSGLDTRFSNTLRQQLLPQRAIDWSRTAAYQSVRGGGLSINAKGRERHGIVEPGEPFRRVRDEVRQALLDYRDPRTGLQPVEDVLVSEQLYSGPQVDLAPDLLVQPSALWSFPYTETPSGASDWPSGAHRRQGIILAAGGRTVPGGLGERDIADVAATALAFCGVTAPIDGLPIMEIAGRQEHSDVDSGTDVQMDRAPADLTDAEQAQMAEHLRNLGYIE